MRNAGKSISAGSPIRGHFYFGQKSLAKEDLARVEEHTATTSEKLADIDAHLADVKEDIKRVEGEL